MMKNKKLLYFGMGLLFTIILTSGFFIYSKGSIKYFVCSDHYTVSCYQDSEKIGNIPCSNDKNCSIENMGAYCRPGYFNQLECPGARYYCDDNGYCKGCSCFSFLNIPEIETSEEAHGPKEETILKESTKKEVTPKALTDLEKCLAIPGLYGRVDCLEKIDITEADLAICKKMETKLKKDRCYGDIAEAKQDQNLCGRIQTLDEKDYCYRRVAITRQDFALCKKIQDSPHKVYCYKIIAKIKQNPLICNEIEDQFIRENCYTIIAAAK